MKKSAKQITGMKHIMKKSAKQITGIFLSVILTATMAAAAVPAANAAEGTSSVTLSFSGGTNMKNERALLGQYAPARFGSSTPSARLTSTKIPACSTMPLTSTVCLTVPAA